MYLNSESLPSTIIEKDSAPIFSQTQKFHILWQKKKYRPQICNLTSRQSNLVNICSGRLFKMTLQLKIINIQYFCNYFLPKIPKYQTQKPTKQIEKYYSELSYYLHNPHRANNPTLRSYSEINFSKCSISGFSIHDKTPFCPSD